MRYLRLFSVLLLSVFAITGCHRRREQAIPAPQAQAPIVTTLPPVPPLTFPDVQLEKPKPARPVVATAPKPKPKRPPTAKTRHRRVVHKAEPATPATASPAPAPKVSTSSPAAAASDASVTTNGASATGASVLGQLSADDTTLNPHQNIQTHRLIERTEERLKKASRAEKAEHKEALAQVASFLAQAKQAWAMNDVVGATTLANKAKILLDELLK